VRCATVLCFLDFDWLSQIVQKKKLEVNESFFPPRVRGCPCMGLDMRYISAVDSPIVATKTFKRLS
jgi:hypothetical protein